MRGSKPDGETGGGESDTQLYDRFVERYFDTEEEKVPEEWPEAVRKRCAFFLNLARSGFEGSLGPKSTLSDVAVDDAVDAQSLVGNRRYVVEGEIARGGMGRILLAEDRDLRRHIAIKVLRTPSNDPAQVSRFLDEAQATAQLEHPNIGPLYDVGVDSSKSPYFTMK